MKEITVNQPSEEVKRKMIEFFMKTSVPRILAALERGELIWDEDAKCVRVPGQVGKGKLNEYQATSF